MPTNLYRVGIDHDLGARLKAAAEERLVGERLLVEKAIDDLLTRLVPVDELDQHAAWVRQVKSMDDAELRVRLARHEIPDETADAWVLLRSLNPDVQAVLAEALGREGAFSG